MTPIAESALRQLFEAVMANVDPATHPGLTTEQRCALGAYAKPRGMGECSPWVPTADTLPPEETPVLLFRKGAIVIGERQWERPSWDETFDSFWFWTCPNEFWIDDIDVADVTHWAPLPAPPGDVTVRVNPSP